MSTLNRVSNYCKYTTSIHIPLDLKASPLKRAGVVPKRSGSVGTAEDVLVQVDAPDEVLVLPSLAQTGKLDVHGAIVLKHVVTLAEESGELLDTDVLAHLELGDLVKLLGGNVAVVHAQDVALLLGDTGGAESVSGVSGTLLSDGDTGNLGAVVETGEFGKSAPAAANVEQSLALLEVELLANKSHLVVLEFLESLLTSGVRDNTTGVDHARAEEVSVVVIAGVVVRTDLLHVLLTGVEKDITCESAEQELHERPGQLEVGPVVAVLKNIEQVTVDVDLAVDVHLGEILERNLGAAVVLAPQLVGLEGQVGLNGAVGQLSLLVNARAEAGFEGPESDQDGEEKHNSKEDHSLPAAADVPPKEDGHTEQAEQSIVAEAFVAGTFSRERSIVDCRVLEDRSAWIEWDLRFAGTGTAVQTGQTYIGHRDADIVLLKRGRLGRGSLDEVDVLGDKALVGGHVCSSEGNPNLSDRKYITWE